MRKTIRNIMTGPVAATSVVAFELPATARVVDDEMYVEVVETGSNGGGGLFCCLDCGVGGG